MSFDYDAAAELYPSRSRASRRQPVGYKRFDRAAEALRYAVEELPPEALVGAYLEISEERFDARQMRALYDADEYPLKRNGAPPAPEVYARPTAVLPKTDAASPSDQSADSTKKVRRTRSPGQRDSQ